MTAEKGWEELNRLMTAAKARLDSAAAPWPPGTIKINEVAMEEAASITYAIGDKAFVVGVRYWDGEWEWAWTFARPPGAWRLLLGIHRPLAGEEFGESRLDQIVEELKTVAAEYRPGS